MCPNKAHRDIVVIGGSAGGLEAVRVILRDLSRDLDASLFIALHTAPDSRGLLDAILGRFTSLTVKYADHGERVRPGHVYLARPDRHLLLKGDVICVRLF